MSIEQAIQENTAELRNVIAALSNFGKPLVHGSGQTSDAAPPKPAKAATPTGKPAAAAPAPAPVATLDYETVVNPKIMECVKKAGREITIAILAQFKGPKGEPAKNGKEIQLPDYPELIAKCDEAITLRTAPAAAAAEAPLV